MSNIVGTIVWGDNHSPYMCMDSHRAVYAFAKDKKPKNHVHIGDCLDLYSISRWAKDDFKGQVDEPIRDAFVQLGQHFNTVAKINPKSTIYWILGNHDDRIEKFARKHPAWWGILNDISELLRYYGKCTADVKIVKLELPEDDFMIGKMHFCHGYYTNKYCAAKHVEEYEDNVCHGHSHTIQMFSKSRKGVPRVGISVGHLMNSEGMKYMKAQPSRAVRGFGYMEHIEPSGQFTFHLLPIVGGKFIFDGKVYDGTKKG